RAGDHLPGLPQEVRQQAALHSGLRRIEPMLIGSVCLALRRSPVRPMKAAHGPAPHRGSFAPLARALRGQTVDERALNFMLSVVKGIEPQDQVEAMLGAQMAAVHNAMMTFARRLAHVETIPQQDSALARALRG